ncbi:MAG: bifunctional oligoribonuclease/PAP phosphatase NrnA [Puniceicoccales bacterium]|jgi:phosphoesterase RecJ-like protein|nr:bifunctional oligoribonuclease/PAP phosphatase NrnA [Puniceicoccales bacterium]
MNTIEHLKDAEQFFAICRQLEGKQIGILGHLRPDGDCLGAQMAMHEILTHCGATSFIGLSDDVIALNLQWIAKECVFTKPEAMTVDEYIFVDCGVKSRAGDFAKKLSTPLMSIDHHISGEKFARNNFFYPEWAATCEIITDYLYQERWRISSRTATALYAGIATDTGRFSYSATTARTLFLASQLALQGANPHQIFVEIYQNESREKFTLMQRFLSSLKFYNEDTICIGRITEQDYIDTHTASEDTEGFVNYPRAIKGVRIAGIVYDREEDKTRICLRSDEPALRLDLLAAKFFGGGHTCAAAFTVSDTYEKFEKTLINELEIHIKAFSKEHNSASTDNIL